MRNSNSIPVKAARFLLLTPVLLPILGFLVVVVFPYSRDMFIHNLTLDKLKLDFREINHPPDTELIREDGAVGIISGNGNHCDYFVGQLRRYRGTKQDVMDYYHDNWDNQGYFSGLIFTENDRLDTGNPMGNYLPDELDTLLEWLPSSEVPANNFYLIYMLHVGDPPGNDVRCY